MLDKTGQRSIAKRLKTGGKGNEEFLQEKLYSMLERIENLIYLQDFLHIERKNQVEIEQNKRTNKLIIKW